jgi:hypothetical protein
MRIARQEQLHALCAKFVIKNHSLLVWMEWVLGDEEETEVKMLVLECVERLLFEEVADENYLPAIVAHLHYNNIITHITALQNHPREQLRERSGDLLDRIAEI